MTKHKPPLPADVPGFTSVPTRARHDGWTPQKQHDFIVALAESGCVTEAAKAVGMSPHSAYRLRARPDASAFRQSWDIALDYAIRRLNDAAFSRALHGVSRPVFYQGEQIGERRHYDERLTMFLLRYRDPVRYGAWLDGMEARRHPDGAGITLAYPLNRLSDAAHGDAPPEDDPDRPLAEGPPIAAVPDADAEEDDPAWAHLPEVARRMKRVMRAAMRAEDRQAESADPYVFDWRDPDEVLRPRNSKGDGDVA